MSDAARAMSCPLLWQASSGGIQILLLERLTQLDPRFDPD
jgi:hypothetical protein